MARRSENLLIFAGGFERRAKRYASGRTLQAVRKLAFKDKRIARLPIGLSGIISKIMKAVVPCLVLGSSFISTALVVVLILVS